MVLKRKELNRPVLVFFFNANVVYWAEYVPMQLEKGGVVDILFFRIVYANMKIMGVWRDELHYEHANKFQFDFKYDDFVLKSLDNGRKRSYPIVINIP